VREQQLYDIAAEPMLAQQGRRDRRDARALVVQLAPERAESLLPQVPVMLDRRAP